MIVWRLRLAVAMTLILLATTGYSLNFNVLTQWYEDGSFEDVVGFQESSCDDYTSSGGVQSNWRAIIITNCNTGNQQVHCSYWNGSSWQDRPCYLDGARVHIPVGSS